MKIRLTESELKQFIVESVKNILSERYDDKGFNTISGIHKVTRTKYDPEGYDKDGFNIKGIDREGFNRDGFNKRGYDKDGYGRSGFNPAGYNRDGIDRDGYNKEGYDKYGYDRNGFNSRGFNRNNVDINGRTDVEFIQKYFMQVMKGKKYADLKSLMHVANKFNIHFIGCDSTISKDKLKFKPFSEDAILITDYIEEWSDDDYDDSEDIKFAKMLVKNKLAKYINPLALATTKEISPFLVSKDGKNFYRCNKKGEQISPTYVGYGEYYSDSAFILDDKNGVHIIASWNTDDFINWENKESFSLNDNITKYDMNGLFFNDCGIYNNDTHKLVVLNGEKFERENVYVLKRGKYFYFFQYR